MQRPVHLVAGRRVDVFTDVRWVSDFRRFISFAMKYINFDLVNIVYRNISHMEMLGGYYYLVLNGQLGKMNPSSSTIQLNCTRLLLMLIDFVDN
jgi:hypothetical protein